MRKTVAEIRRVLLRCECSDTLAAHPQKEILRALNMLTHDGNEVVRQRACRELAQRIVRRDSMKIETFIRRLLWRLNPESGDYPIGVPELLGEIGNRSPEKISGAIPAMLYYLEDETLRPGLLQAAGRIGQRAPRLVAEYIEQIAGLLHDPDPRTAANAAVALLRIGEPRAREKLQQIRNDPRVVALCCRKGIRKIKLRELIDNFDDAADEACFVAAEQ